MTATCTLSDGVKTVDFVQALSATATAVVHSINLRHSNPIITFSTPMAAGGKLGSNTVIINIGMVKNSFDISFELHDGVGTFSTAGSTNYEKLLYLSSTISNPKKLTMNGTEFDVQFESLSMPWDAGKNNLILNGSMTLTTCMDIKMS